MGIFLCVSVGVPFVLVTFLPTWYALFGTIGVQLITGLVLYLVLVYLSGSKS